MSGLFLLDTNAASALMYERQPLSARAARPPFSMLSVSAVTAAEIEYGLAKRPSTTALRKAARAFLSLIAILPWTEEIAPHYGTLRASLEGDGLTIAPLDLMIAAHALAIDATLISADKALAQIGIVKIEDWNA